MDKNKYLVDESFNSMGKEWFLYVFEYNRFEKQRYFFFINQRWKSKIIKNIIYSETMAKKNQYRFR